LRARGSELARDYENFARSVGEKPRDVFSLEDWALWISTCLLSVVVSYWGCRELVDDNASFRGFIVLAGILVSAACTCMWLRNAAEPKNPSRDTGAKKKRRL
jgi:hypothetical protein